MRSFHRNLNFVAALSFVGAACGGDGGSGNETPTAAFTFECTLLVCNFTDTSTDPDGASDITSWSWDFGGDGTSEEQSPAHTFSAAGTYQVTLTVTDAGGASNTSAAQAVTVSTTPGNQAPTAAFTVDCASLECTFIDGSSDADGTIASYAWDFGESGSPDNTSEEQNPTHTYSFDANTEVTVTLTVTDDEGATGTTTQSFTVAPPAGFVLDPFTSPASVTVTLTSSDCEAVGNTFIILTPVLDTLFTDGCNSPEPGTPGATFQLDNGAVFDVDTEITGQVISGLPDQEVEPAIQVTGVFPNWILKFDDGRGGPGEPDFNDLELTITANP
jgi:PKD repeat protein